MPKNSHVPILVTWDVDPDRWTTLEKRRQALNMAIDLCQAFDIRSTFFITAQFAHEYPNELRRMQDLGQEIGCHGLAHTAEEEYDRMPEAMQRAYIEDATDKLEAVTGGPVCTFRSPRVKTSATTLRLLAERGYLADSSVCSQRLDILSSNLINKGWVLAPRQSYHPHQANPFRRGDLPIWEVPLSALGVPFISKALSALGISSAKVLFKLLYAESRRTGKPIVYLTHPTEFILSMGKGPPAYRYFNPKFFSPRYVRTHGFLVRNLLLRMDGKALFSSTQELFSYMASFHDVTFMAMEKYIVRRLQQVS